MFRSERSHGKARHRQRRAAANKLDPEVVRLQQRVDRLERLVAVLGDRAERSKATEGAPTSDVAVDGRAGFASAWDRFDPQDAVGDEFFEAAYPIDERARSWLLASARR